MAGVVIEYDVPVQMRDGVILRADVTSSCFPRWDRNLNTLDGPESVAMQVARQAVHLGGPTSSFITLPVIPR